MKILNELIKKCENGGTCPNLHELSINYKHEFKISDNPFTYTGKMTSEVGMKIADVYESLTHLPNTKIVNAAYAQLAEETYNQFEYILKNEKIEFEPYEGNGEPYANSYEMLADIFNYHMYFFKTEKGFGETEYKSKNTMLTKTGYKIGKYELTINDMLRIIHDIFGHAQAGNGFGPIGEDMAWYTHIGMLSPLAGAAISAETRGQNCWVNFGPHMRDENNILINKTDSRWLAPQHRPFAEQKMNLLPSSICGIEVFEEQSQVQAKYISEWQPLESVKVI